MINVNETRKEINAIIEAECIEFGKWLLKAVMVHPGLSMEELLRRFNDE